MADQVLKVDLVASLKSAIKDPEFSREMRFFTGAMKIGVGGDFTVARFEDGKLMEVSVTQLSDSECKIVINGTNDQWEKMLEKYPIPFYQCLQTTSVKHGLKMSVTNETFAYLPALNRLVQFMREQRN